MHGVSTWSAHKHEHGQANGLCFRLTHRIWVWFDGGSTHSNAEMMVGCRLLMTCLLRDLGGINRHQVGQNREPQPNQVQVSVSSNTPSMTQAAYRNQLPEPRVWRQRRRDLQHPGKISGYLFKAAVLISPGSSLYFPTSLSCSWRIWYPHAGPVWRCGYALALSLSDCQTGIRLPCYDT